MCTGSLLLGAAGILDGLRGHDALAASSRRCGATARGRPASASCAQGKVITAAGVSSGIDMALASPAQHRRRRRRPRRSSSLIEYDPQPPFDCGSVDKAAPETIAADPRGGRGASARRHGRAPACDAPAPLLQRFHARRGSLRGRRYGPAPAWTCAPPSTSTSASPTSAPARRRRSRPPSPAATCSSSCRRARASRSATSCPALLRDDLTIVVSPLVSLMQDQVDGARAPRAPGAVALVNAQQDAGDQPRRCWRARAPASCACSTSRPSASPRPASSRRCARCRSACSSSTRRTASRSGATTSAPTTSASPTPRAGCGAEAIVASTATATPQVAARHRRAAGAARARCASRPASTARTCRSPSCRARARPTSTRRIAAALADPAARPAIVYAGTRARRRGARRRAQRRARHRGRSPTTPAWPATSAPTRSGASWTARSRSSSRPTRSAWASTRPTCARSRTSRARRRSRPTTRRPAAPGATGAPARALLFAEPRDKGLHVFFIERAEVVRRPARPGRRAAAVAAAADGRYRRWRSAIARTDDARAGARDRRPPRPGRRASRRRRRRWTACAGGCSAPYDGRARATAARRPPRASARAGASTASVWAFVEGDGCRRAAILRHFGDPAAPRADVPCCDVCAPESVAWPTAAAAARMRATAGSRRGRPAAAPDDLDEAIVDVVARRQPVGRAHARGRDPARRALEGRRCSTARTAAGLRRRSRTCAPTTCSPASTRCSPTGGSARPAAPTRSSRAASCAGAA